VRFPAVVLFFVLGALSVMGDAKAAPNPPVEKLAVATGTQGVAIVPHRAIYDMNLASVKNGGNVTGVSGKMIFEWADACDGWAIQQNLQLHFDYAQGDTSNVASNEVTWESKDGKRYNFNIRRMSDGKQTENFRGKATLTGSDGKAIYSSPEGKTVALTGETLFPSAHTRMIIGKAEAGERFFTRRVFDGTDEGGASDVSVFIAPPQTQHLEAGADADLSANSLLAATVWPVHMAFFKLNDDTGAPDYEMDLLLLANGVARSMKIDYGDFSVTGTLKAIEPLPVPHC
jgi:hypothetical protein